MARRPAADTEGLHDIVEAHRPWGAKDQPEDLADRAREAKRLGSPNANVDNIELHIRQSAGTTVASSVRHDFAVLLWRHCFHGLSHAAKGRIPGFNCFELSNFFEVIETGDAISGDEAKAAAGG
jgi:hypothetical protein